MLRMLSMIFFLGNLFFGVLNLVLFIGAPDAGCYGLVMGVVHLTTVAALAPNVFRNVSPQLADSGNKKSD